MLQATAAGIQQQPATDSAHGLWAEEQQQHGPGSPGALPAAAEDGLLARCVDQLFARVAAREQQGAATRVRVSCCEVYVNEAVTDMLVPRQGQQLQVRQIYAAVAALS